MPTPGFEPRTSYTLGGCLTYCVKSHVSAQCSTDHLTQDRDISYHSIIKKVGEIITKKPLEKKNKSDRSEKEKKKTKKQKQKKLTNRL